MCQRAPCPLPMERILPLRTSMGTTALDIAKERQHPTCILALMEHNELLSRMKKKSGVGIPRAEDAESVAFTLDQIKEKLLQSMTLS